MNLNHLIGFTLISALCMGCTSQPDTPTPVENDTVFPILVQPDGSYPTKPLEKDTVIVKVIQTTVNSLSKFPSVEEGLEHNLQHMEEMADKACTTGKKTRLSTLS